MLALVVLFICFSLAIYTYLIIPIFLSPLAAIPKAHFTSSFSPLWLRWKRRSGKTGIYATFSAHNKYGPVVQLSPNELSVASLDGLRRIYEEGFDKSSFYNGLTNYGTPNLVSTLKSKPHSVRKRILAPVYSKSFVQNSEDLKIASRVLIFEKLLPILHAASIDETPFNAYGLNSAIGADFLSSYSFGLSRCTNFLKDVATRNKITDAYRTKIRGLSGKEKASHEVENFVLSLCESAKIISVTDENGYSTRAVVHEQLLHQLSGKSEQETSKEIASEMYDHLWTAIETSRIILTYVQWELSRRIDLQRALRNELLTLFSPIVYQPRKSYASQEGIPILPDFEELGTLPLLDAIIKETLRLRSPSLAIQPRLTPPGGTVIDGYSIPGGITVGTSAYCLHRNEKIFLNASTFQPRRWLVNEYSDQLKDMNQWFWPFGSGPRMCIAHHFVINMLKLSVAAIYTNYETKIMDDGGNGIEQEDMFISGPKGEKLVLRFRHVE